MSLFHQDLLASSAFRKQQKVLRRGGDSCDYSLHFPHSLCPLRHIIDSGQIHRAIFEDAQ
eukprot:scaffold3169_cov277-Chaetoceros_neogracile.AAC.4